HSIQLHESTAAPLLRIASTSPANVPDRDTTESLSDRAQSRVAASVPLRRFLHVDSRYSRGSQSRRDCQAEVSKPDETRPLPDRTVLLLEPSNRAGSKGSH